MLKPKKNSSDKRRIKFNLFWYKRYGIARASVGMLTGLDSYMQMLERTTDNNNRICICVLNNKFPVCVCVLFLAGRYMITILKETHNGQMKWVERKKIKRIIYLNIFTMCLSFNERLYRVEYEFAGDETIWKVYGSIHIHIHLQWTLPNRSSCWFWFHLRIKPVVWYHLIRSNRNDLTVALYVISRNIEFTVKTVVVGSSQHHHWSDHFFIDEFIWIFGLKLFIQ